MGFIYGGHIWGSYIGVIWWIYMGVLCGVGLVENPKICIFFWLTLFLMYF